MISTSTLNIFSIWQLRQGNTLNEICNVVFITQKGICGDRFKINLHFWKYKITIEELIFTEIRTKTVSLS